MLLWSKWVFLLTVTNKSWEIKKLNFMGVAVNAKFFMGESVGEVRDISGFRSGLQE